MLRQFNMLFILNGKRVPYYTYQLSNKLALIDLRKDNCERTFHRVILIG